jgi:hypothetical protein
MATPDQLAMLRAMAEGDFERQEEISHALRASGGLDGYGEVIGAAFFIAIHLQFQERYSPEDVINLVARARTKLDSTGDLIDPRAAELIVRSALGEGGLMSDVPPARVMEAQIAICSVLAAEGKLGAPDAFMQEVEKLVDEWSA